MAILSQPTSRLYGAVLAALLLLLPAGSWAEGQAGCADVRFPAQDLPDSATIAALKDCDSEALYYGIGMPADPVRARACAFAERGGDDGPFSGDALLMTIYANGSGVARNLDIALALACKIGGAPAEIEGRRAHLMALKTGAGTGEFSWCDDITSGAASAYCADHEARIEQPKNQAQLAELAKRWTGATALLFARLREASDAFADSLAKNEVSPMGTAHAALEVAAKASTQRQLNDDLKAFADNKPPSAGAETATGADAQLNAVYRKIMRVPAEPFAEDTGRVQQAGIKETQRIWLKYRDAWLAFTASAYPGLPKGAVINWLTLRRVNQLAEFVRD